MAISESLKSDKRVFNQGIRNFNDGVSLLNIADGAIESLSGITIRLKELAEQSANGTYSLTQRKAIDKEAQALSKEYTRIVHSTKFNGVHLLDGSLGNGVRLQGGYGVDGSIFSGIGGAIGTGDFRQISQLTYSSTINYSLSTGDLNGDGNIDLVTGDGVLPGLTRAFLGEGSGVFVNSSTLASETNRTYSAKLADINNDGILDLVTGGRTGISPSEISIFIGNNDGTFNEINNITTSSLDEMQIADINNDGNLDIIYDNNNAISYNLGDGKGSFSSTQSFSVLPQLNDTYAFVLGDLNGDGITDLTVGGTYSGSARIGVYFGSSTGIFSHNQTLSPGGSTIRSLAIGDLNSDGKLDILSSSNATGLVNIYLNDGSGAIALNSSLSAESSSTEEILLADINGDSHLDIITAGISGVAGQVNIFTNNGKANFSKIKTIASEGSGTYSVAMADFNKDGVLDLFTGGAESGSAKVTIYEGLKREGAAPLLPFDLSTLSGAKQALPLLDQKIQQLAKQRGQIGAFQSRVQVGINNLQAASENYAAAESRIRDADIADESSKLLRLNILQQAASSVLAQANLQPELALKLLG